MRLCIESDIEYDDGLINLGCSNDDSQICKTIAFTVANVCINIFKVANVCINKFQNVATLYFQQ